MSGEYMVQVLAAVYKPVAETGGLFPAGEGLRGGGVASWAGVKVGAKRISSRRTSRCPFQMCLRSLKYGM